MFRLDSMSALQVLRDPNFPQVCFPWHGLGVLSVSKQQAIRSALTVWWHYRCYVTRTSLKCVSPGMAYGSGDFPDGNNKDVQRWKADDDTRVCFQYSAIDKVPKNSEHYKSNDELYDQLVKDLKSYGAQEVQVSFHCAQMLESCWG